MTSDPRHIVYLSRTPLHGEVTVLKSKTQTRIPVAEKEIEVVTSVTIPGFSLATGILGKFAVVLLVPMMLIYPLTPAFAADEATTTATTTESVPVAGATNTQDVITAPAATSEATTTDTKDSSLVADVGSAFTGIISSIFGASTTESITSSREASTSPTGDENIASSSNRTASTTVSDTASTTDILGGQSSASTTLRIETASSTASSSDALIDETASTTISAPVKTAEEIAQEMLSAKEDSLRASIRKEVEDEYKKGCVSLDTTGYYCIKDRQAGINNTLTPSSVVTDVSSQEDTTTHYKQIFMTKGGVSTQITHDAWDNTFPTTDISGKSITWQANISGRWQIFFTDTATSGAPTAVQVTHTNESNFNPKVDGRDIVWQGWVDGNWEIFLAERLDPAAYLPIDTLPKENTMLGIDRTWRVTRITTNGVHDMFPAVAGELVTWQSFQDNAWNVYVYSMKTQATQRLSSGVEKSEKPRFAITWDQRSDSGDARMVGYDIATGKTIDITSEARQVNEEKTPYKQPTAPISQPDQAALPTVGSGATTTTAKGDSEGGAGNDLAV